MSRNESVVSEKADGLRSLGLPADVDERAEDNQPSEEDKQWLLSPLSLPLSSVLVDGVSELQAIEIQRDVERVLSFPPDSVEGGGREWKLLLKLLRRKWTASPMDFLLLFPSQSTTERVVQSHPGFFGEVFAYVEAPSSFFALHLVEEKKKMFVGVKFVTVRQKDPQKQRRRYGFASRDEFWIPSLESAILAVRHSLRSVRAKRQVWRDWQGSLWGWSRRKSGVLCAVLPLFDWRIDLALSKEDHPGPTVSCIQVQKAAIRTALEGATDDAVRVDRVVDVLRQAGVPVECSGSEESVPHYAAIDEGSVEVAEVSGKQAVGEGTSAKVTQAGVESSLSTCSQCCRDVDHLLSIDRLGPLAEAFDRKVVREEIWEGLYEGVDISFVESPREGSTLWHILTFDRLALTSRPLGLLRQVLELSHRHGFADRCRFLVQEAMAKSTRRQGLRALGMAMRRSPWLEKGREDWYFSVGGTQEQNRREAAARFLQPLGYRIVGCSGKDNLSIPRTVGFLLCLNMDRLPPHVWRLGALMSMCAVFIRGSLESVRVSRMASFPSSRQVADIVQAMNEGVPEPSRFDEKQAMDLVSGHLAVVWGDTLHRGLNTALEQMVHGYFRHAGKESRSRRSMQVPGAFTYECLQVVPFMTGRALLVGRTVGSMAGLRGEVHSNVLEGRDSYDDKVAVYDVFAVSPGGIPFRSTGTFFSFDEAYRAAGSTPYLAWWSSLKGVGHLDPVISPEDFKLLLQGNAVRSPHADSPR